MKRKPKIKEGNHTHVVAAAAMDVGWRSVVWAGAVVVREVPIISGLV